MSNEKLIEDLKYFNELEYFIKKYNSFVNIFEKLQDVLTDKELKRMHECATWLKYAVFKTENGFEKKLVAANFCKSRWCDVCNWRRRIKYFNINYEKVVRIKQEHNARFIFLTLTTKNVYYKNLKEGIKEILTAFKKLLKSYRIANNKAILGILRSLEFTIQKSDKRYVNLHIHCLIAVKTSYFNKNYDWYINQREWTELWKKALNVSYTPIVDVRLVKNVRTKKKNKINRRINEEGAIFEITKYLYKSFQFQDIKVEVLKEIVNAFKNVRLIAPIGVFRSKKSEIEIENDKEDLIKIGNEDISGEFLGEVEYVLNEGQYKLRRVNFNS
jgi:plasmid rolling circle replication initiator protein Rep